MDNHNAMTIPAHLQAMAGDGFNEFAAGIGGSRGPHISFNNGQFTLVGTDGVQKPPVNQQGHVLYDPSTGSKYIDIVLVAAGEGLSKVYYQDGYSPGDNAPPDCWSNDGKFPDGLVADPPAPSCAACPYDVFGSKITPAGVQIKACSDRKKVAALYLYDIRGPLYEMTVSPSNLKGFAAYAQDLAGRVPGGVRSVVTRVTADSTRVGGLLFSVAPNPATATAQYPQGTGYWFVPEAFMPILQAARNSQECRKAIGADVTPRRPALAGPAAYAAPLAALPPVEHQPQLAPPVAYAPPAQPAYTPQPVQHFAPVEVAPPATAYALPPPVQPVYTQPVATYAQPQPSYAQPAPQMQPAPAPVAEAPARKRRTKAEIEAARGQQPAMAPVQQFQPPQGYAAAGPVAQPQPAPIAHDLFAPPGAATAYAPPEPAQYQQPAPASVQLAAAYDPFTGAPVAVQPQPAAQPQPAQFGVVTQPQLVDPALDAMLAKALGPQ